MDQPPDDFDFPVPPGMEHMAAQAHQRFRRPDWEAPPSHLLPGYAAIEHLAGRSDRAIVQVACVRAYPTGFSFELRGLLRDPDPAIDQGMFGAPMHAGSADGGLPPQLMRIAFTYADGATVSSLDMFAGSGFGQLDEHGNPSRPTMMQHGGGGGAGEYRWDHWCWPLPPAGEVRVICEWPAVGIDRQVTSFDAQVVLDAAARAEQLWDEPPPPPDDPFGGGGDGARVIVG